MSCCISVDAPWREEHCGTNPTSLPHFYQKLLAKSVRRPDDVIMWPQMTFQREMMRQRASDIKHLLSGYDSGWVGQIWYALEVLQCFTIDLTGEVMKLTWPVVTDITNQRYTSRIYLCPYCRLRVLKSFDLWSVFDRLSNFENCNLRSGHLTLPGGATLEARRSKCSGNVSKRTLNSYTKFGGGQRQDACPDATRCMSYCCCR